MHERPPPSPLPLLQDRDKAESVLVDQGRQHQAAEERTREIYEVGPFGGGAGEGVGLKDTNPLAANQICMIWGRA